MLVEVLHRLIGVVVLVFLLARLSDWISAHIQGLAFLLSRSHQVATFFLFLVLAPGIFIHELSHWLFARLLGVRTKGFRVWPKRTRRGHIQLGAVQVQGAGPISMALIGLAPFIVGTIALVVLGGWLQARQPSMADWQAWFAGAGWETLTDFFSRGDWPWRFYAIWVIANSMMPSASDREPVMPLIGVLVLLSVAAYFVGVSPTLPDWAYTKILDVLDILAGAFFLAVIGNAIVALGIAVVEHALSLMLGARVDYG